jgi:branched-chain amino acid transport system ATP-binding protein
VPDLLVVSNLCVAYGGVKAVKGIDLKLRAGSVTALIGSNGAGKTSTIRGITNMERSTGTVVLDGKDISRVRTPRIARLGVAQVPQGRRIFPQMTVDENLALGSYGRKVRSRRDDVFQLFPRLEERHTQQAGSLSGGEQQMLAIGRAIMADPVVILMDEPSLGLAPLLVKEVFGAVRSIVDMGVSVLLVEQNATQALAVSDEVYVLDKGRVAYEGDVEKARAELDLVAAYIG